MRLSLLLLMACGLAACALPPARNSRTAPVKPPVASTPPAAKPPAAPPRPSSIDPGNYQRDKERLRQSLARNDRDSLSPREVGYYMDVLLGRLRQIGNSQFGLAHEGSRIVVTLIGTSLGGNQVDPPLPALLTTLAKVLAEYRKTFVSVQAEAGGDDSKARHCALLAARRLGSGGVIAQHIAVVGVAPASTPAGTGDFSGCSTIVLQLEPIVRVE